MISLKERTLTIIYHLRVHPLKKLIMPNDALLETIRLVSEIFLDVIKNKQNILGDKVKWIALYS